MRRNYLPKSNIMVTSIYGVSIRRTYENGNQYQHGLLECILVVHGIRDAAWKYCIPKSSLSRYVIAAKTEKQGRKAVFNKREVTELTNCLVDLASLGFPMNYNDLGELVESYSMTNNVTRALNVFNYKERRSYPGPDWIKSFMERNNLFFKEATKLSSHRYNPTKNPFIINNFYGLLQKFLNELDLADRPNLIRNADESGLPSEPNK